METLFTEVDIRERVAKVADAVATLNPQGVELIIPIMHSAFIFTADLMRALYPNSNAIITPLRLVRVPRILEPNRYQAIGPLGQLNTIPGGISGKSVLVVDTVMDTGVTMSTAIDMVKKHSPKKITSAVLVWKQTKDHGYEKPDIAGWVLQEPASNKVLVGYGMDQDGKHRGNRNICYL